MIRIANESDLDQLVEVEKNCFSDPWTHKMFENELKNPLTTYYVYEKDSEVLGYIGYWKIEDEAHITNIAVVDKYRGMGISQEIMDFFISNLDGINAVTLEVRQSNIRAIKFYEKYDFKNYGERKNYYNDPVENAIIMWKYLKGDANCEQ